MVTQGMFIVRRWTGWVDPLPGVLAAMAQCFHSVRLRVMPGVPTSREQAIQAPIRLAKTASGRRYVDENRVADVFMRVAVVQ